MRHLVFPCIVAGLLQALSPATVFGQASAGQQTVGTLDFFGLRRITEADVRAKLRVKEGDAFRREDRATLAAELEKIPGVKRATVVSITVDGSGQLRLFVGIEEEGARGFVLGNAPTGSQRLPEEMARVYQDFSNGLGPAIRAGRGTENHSEGHALSEDPTLRQAQDAAIAIARAHVPTLQDVLKSSANTADRCAAAWLLGYAPDKKAILADLTAAARDPDAGVRNNATRALGVIAEYAAAHPKLGIEIDPTVFLDMLASVTWTDRNKASFVLLGMTQSRPPKLLDKLRERSLPELSEMARWKSKGHNGAAVQILGRIAGWKDDVAHQTWANGEVEKIIAAARKS